MQEYLLLKLAHILAFVYWLGGDLGTFLASRYVTKTDISPESRAIALKIMLGCDQGPKLAMPAILALGIAMGSQLNLIQLPSGVLSATLVICLLWFLNVNYLYFTNNDSNKQLLTKIDFWFRVAIITVITLTALSHFAGYNYVNATWISYKLLIFAALVGCGLMIRISLKPFTPAFMKLMTEGPTEATNAALTASLNRARPFVYVIWIGLLLSAAIGLHIF